MLEKASRLNCEYVVRPAVALSEMADTVSSNVGILKEAPTNADEAKMIREVEKMNKIVKMFNTRTYLPVTSSDVHHLLKHAINNDDEDSDDTCDKMEHLGMLLYVIGSHQNQLRSLIRNPIDYSKKCEDLPAKHEFEVNTNLKSLKNWWASETVTTQTKRTVITSSYGRNLLADLGNNTDSNDKSAREKRKKANKKAPKAPSTSLSLLSSLVHFMRFIFSLFLNLLLFSRCPSLLQDDIGQWRTINTRLFRQNGPDTRLCGMFTGKFTHLQETLSILISRVFLPPTTSPTKDYH